MQLNFGREKCTICRYKPVIEMAVNNFKVCSDLIIFLKIIDSVAESILFLFQNVLWITIFLLYIIDI